MVSRLVAPLWGALTALVTAMAVLALPGVHGPHSPLVAREDGARPFRRPVAPRPAGAAQEGAEAFAAEAAPDPGRQTGLAGLRWARGYQTQAALARASGVSARRISAYETGHALPYRPDAARLARALGRSPDEVVAACRR